MYIIWISFAIKHIVIIPVCLIGPLEQEYFRI